MYGKIGDNSLTSTARHAIVMASDVEVRCTKRQLAAVKAANSRDCFAVSLYSLSLPGALRRGVTWYTSSTPAGSLFVLAVEGREESGKPSYQGSRYAVVFLPGRREARRNGLEAVHARRPSRRIARHAQTSQSERQSSRDSACESHRITRTHHRVAGGLKHGPSFHSCPHRRNRGDRHLAGRAGDLGVRHFPLNREAEMNVFDRNMPVFPAGRLDISGDRAILPVTGSETRQEAVAAAVKGDISTGKITAFRLLGRMGRACPGVSSCAFPTHSPLFRALESAGKATEALTTRRQHGQSRIVIRTGRGGTPRRHPPLPARRAPGNRRQIPRVP